MSQIAADLARRTQAAATEAAGGGVADGPGGAGAELDLFARLSVSLDANSAALRQARAALSVPWDVCHIIPLNPVQNSAAGTITDERWEPREGFAWHVLRVSVQSQGTGGATSALLVQDAAAAGAYNLQLVPPPGTAGTAGSFLGTWEPKGKFLLPGQRLILVTTAGGAIMNGEAVEIALDWLPRYLM